MRTSTGLRPGVTIRYPMWAARLFICGMRTPAFSGRPCPFRRGATPYITTHGFGYTLFKHTEQGISTECTVFVDKALPVKFIVLKIVNQSGRERKMSVTGCME